MKKKKNTRKNNKEITMEDLFGSIPLQDPNAIKLFNENPILNSIDLESLTYKQPIQKVQHSVQHSVQQPIQKVQHSVQQPIQKDLNLFEENILQCKATSPSLTSKQLKVLFFVCLERPFRIKGKFGISDLMEIPYGTVRSALKSLEKKDYIRKLRRFNDHLYGKSTCEINIPQCKKLFKNLPKKLTKKIFVFQHSTDQKVTASTLDINSSSTTTFFDCILEKNTDFSYWKQNGLSKKQFTKWMTIGNCNEETLLRYLSYCRFEMVDLGIEESKPVDNVLNWFYKILERNGSYPKPKGYKSFEEKRIEEEREILTEQKRLAAEKEQLYRDKIKAERDAEFYEILANPNHELYKKCFEKLNKFVRGRKGKKSFEMAMRKVFDELVEGE